MKKLLMKDWRRTTIGEICHFSNGHGFTPRHWSIKGLPIIRIQNLNGSDNFNYFDGKPDPTWIVEPGELLFAWAGVAGVSFGPTVWQGPRAVLNQHIYRITPCEGIDLDWLYAALKVVTSRIERKAHGFKSSLLHVRKSDITDQHIRLPKLEEQKEIARIIAVANRTIDLTEHLIAAKQERRTWLMQQLLTGKRRLPGFEKAWTEVHLREHLKEVSIRNKGRSVTRVLSVTNNKGFVLPEEQFSRSVASSDLSNYKVVHHGQFAYNPSRINVGSRAMLKNFDIGVISPMYVVFKVNKNLNADFLSYWMESSDGQQRINLQSQGSVRDTVSFGALASIKILLPALNEQCAIVNILKTADRELDLLRSQLDALKEQKKGLMQKLLTGKVRVKERQP